MQHHARLNVCSRQRTANSPTKFNRTTRMSTKCNTVNPQNYSKKLQRKLLRPSMKTSKFQHHVRISVQSCMIIYVTVIASFREPTNGRTYVNVFSTWRIVHGWRGLSQPVRHRRQRRSVKQKITSLCRHSAGAVERVATFESRGDARSIYRRTEIERVRRTRSGERGAAHDYTLARIDQSGVTLLDTRFELDTMQVSIFTRASPRGVYTNTARCCTPRARQYCCATDHTSYPGWYFHAMEMAKGTLADPSFAKEIETTRDDVAIVQITMNNNFDFELYFVNVILTNSSFVLTLFERKISSHSQYRQGPNELFFKTRCTIPWER